MSLPHLLRWALACTVFIGSLSTVQAQDLPPPGQPGSHEAYVEAVTRARAATFSELLARYDTEQAAAPEDADLAVERCRFLQAISFADEDDDPLGVYELLQRCTEDFAERFPSHAGAWLFRAEQTFGEERVTLLRAALSATTDQPSQARARLKLMLAKQLDLQGDAEAAVREARSALADDPTLDVSLILARAAQAKGQRGEAIAWLERGLAHTDPPHELLTKARLLVDLGGFEAADAALRVYEAKVSEPPDLLLQARVLEGLGRVAEARAAYSKLQDGFQAKEALRRRFELDLQKGSVAQAAAAYEALRDHGYENDPFLRQRLRLLWAHPLAPWHARDLLGLLALLGLSLGALLLPAVVLIPVHYVGLLLRERGHVYDSESDWTLYRVGKLFGSVFLADVLVTYALRGELIEAWFTDEVVAPRVTPSDAELSRLLVWCMGASVLVVLGFMRLPRLKHAFAWGRPASPDAKVFRRTARAMGLLLLIAMANALLVAALGLDVDSVEAGAVNPVSTHAMLQALLRSHGVFPLLMLTVIFAPFTEELLFRYALTDALKAYLPLAWTNRVQALCFALMHDQWPLWPSLFFIGLFAGRLRQQTSDLSASFMLHAAWNLMVSLAMAATLR